VNEFCQNKGSDFNLISRKIGSRKIKEINSPVLFREKNGEFV